MLGTIDFTGAVLLALMLLPLLLIAFVGGMLTARSGYLPRLRRERMEKARLIRYAQQRARSERTIGFVIGYRQGSGQ